MSVIPYMSDKTIDIGAVYWINMDESTDRRENMEKITLKNPFFRGVKVVRRVKAVTSRDVKVPHESPIPAVVYACTLSHLRALREYLDTPSVRGPALILEDDMTTDFIDKFWYGRSRAEILGYYFDNAPLSWDILQLCYISHKPITGPAVYEFIWPNNTRGRYSTGAYIIHRDAAARILRLSAAYPDEIPQYIHPAADHYIYSCVATYCAKYPLFIYKFNQQSTIHPRHVEFHDHSRLNIEEIYTSADEGFFYQIGYFTIFLSFCAAGTNFMRRMIGW